MFAHVNELGQYVDIWLLDIRLLDIRLLDIRLLDY